MDLSTPIRYVDHSCFHTADPPAAVAALKPAGSLPDSSSTTDSTAAPGLRLPDAPLLSKTEETYLFCRMNLLKFRAEQMRVPGTSGRDRANEIASLLAEANLLRNRIVNANLRLIIASAKPFLSASRPVADLFSEGVLPLIRSVELFDCERGYRFSTYATHAIRNRFTRVCRRAQTAPHCVFEEPADLAQIPDGRSSADAEQKAAAARRTVSQLMRELPPRDREIVGRRWGLAGFGEPSSLRAIGRMVGLSKERVRQRLLRAMDDIRAAGKEAHCELSWDAA
jgi:RNA polymerase sigma factor (sigma-70 family)